MTHKCLLSTGASDLYTWHILNLYFKFLLCANLMTNLEFPNEFAAIAYEFLYFNITIALRMHLRDVQIWRRLPCLNDGLPNWTVSQSEQKWTNFPLWVWQSWPRLNMGLFPLSPWFSTEWLMYLIHVLAFANIQQLSATDRLSNPNFFGCWLLVPTGIFYPTATRHALEWSPCLAI